MDRCGVCNGNNSGCRYTEKLTLTTSSPLTAEEKQTACDNLLAALKETQPTVNATCAVCCFFLRLRIFHIREQRLALDHRCCNSAEAPRSRFYDPRL